MPRALVLKTTSDLYCPSDSSSIADSNMSTDEAVLKTDYYYSSGKPVQDYDFIILLSSLRTAPGTPAPDFPIVQVYAQNNADFHNFYQCNPMFSSVFNSSWSYEAILTDPVWNPNWDSSNNKPMYEIPVKNSDFSSKFQTQLANCQDFSYVDLDSHDEKILLDEIQKTGASLTIPVRKTRTAEVQEALEQSHSKAEQGKKDKREAQIAACASFHVGQTVWMKGLKWTQGEITEILPETGYLRINGKLFSADHIKKNQDAHK